MLAILYDYNSVPLQVWLEKRYVGSQHTSEWFNTAGRSVKTGLIASVIVSQVHSHFPDTCSFP